MVLLWYYCEYFHSNMSHHACNSAAANLNSCLSEVKLQIKPIGAIYTEGNGTGFPCLFLTYEGDGLQELIALKNSEGYFGLLNLYKTLNVKTNMYYQRAIFNHAKASECLKCGKCEKICPQHISIRENLEKFAAIYEGCFFQ